MKYGKRFNAYMNAYPQAAKPSANRCSQLPYAELRRMAKTIYYRNDDTKNNLYRYMNMDKNHLANAVFNALGNL